MYKLKYKFLYQYWCRCGGLFCVTRSYILVWIWLRDIIYSNFVLDQEFPCFPLHISFSIIPVYWLRYVIIRILLYVVWSKSFRPDIQKPHQMENAVRDI